MSWRSSPSSTPSTGSSVVNGYDATFGAARVRRANSEDLPAFGSPTRPTSASSRRRSSSHPASPASPRSAKRGAWRVGVVKRLFPRPPAAAARDEHALAVAQQLPATTRQIVVLAGAARRAFAPTPASAGATTSLATATATAQAHGPRARRHSHHERLAVGPVAQRAFPATAALLPGGAPCA